MLNFLLTLAGHLGLTLNRLVSEIDRDELLLWMAKHKIDPIGPLRADYNAAATRATLINLAHLAGENKRPSSVEVEDMMPDFGLPDDDDDAELLTEREVWEAWVSMFGG